MNTFFLHQIKHTNGKFDKGIVVMSGGTSEENFAAAKQGYHAYLGAYAYDHDHDHNTDYVSCMITDLSGAVLLGETWIKPEPEPEPNPESEGV